MLIIPGLANCGDASPPAPVVSPSQANNDKLGQQLSEISTKIEDINDKITNLKSNPTGSTTKASSKPKTDSSPASASKPQASESPKVSASATPAPANPKVKGRQILDNVLKVVNNAKGIIVEVDKYERGLEVDKSSTFNLKFWCRKSDSLVKIEVVNSTKTNNIGVKLRYNSGNNTQKVKVRPGGALGLITTELSRTDDNITSINDYTVDGTDFYGISKRLSGDDYEAELIGASKVNGTDIYILKVTSKTDNSLDPRIKYEYVGFEPKTFIIRSWEAFDGKSEEAFFKLQLKTVKFVDDLSDSDFNI